MQINVTDLSSNGTYLNNIKIGKNQTIKAESNDFIILLSQETVGKYEMLGF